MEPKIQWDWKINWPKCRFHHCQKNAYFIENEPLLIDTFHFCEEHYRLLMSERELMLFDAMNPSRTLNENCPNKEWHYKNLCTLGVMGECLCDVCGNPNQFCNKKEGCNK